MWWLPYTALFINLIIIWFMPKRMTSREIYSTWLIVALINLSSDIIFDLYLHLYRLTGSGVQLKVHFLEWTLASSYGILFLNFMPKQFTKFLTYVVGWLAYSLIFELALVHLRYINYTGWNIWYSAPFYVFYMVYLRWHIHFLRK